MERLPSIAEMSVNPINPAPPEFNEELLNAILGAQARLNRRKQILVTPVKIKSGEVFSMESGGKYLCTSRGNFVRLDKQMSKKARRRAARQIQKKGR